MPTFSPTFSASASTQRAPPPCRPASAAAVQVVGRGGAGEFHAPVSAPTSLVPPHVAQEYGVASFRYVRPSGEVGKGFRRARGGAAAAYGNPYFEETRPKAGGGGSAAAASDEGAQRYASRRPPAEVETRSSAAGSQALRRAERLSRCSAAAAAAGALAGGTAVPPWQEGGEGVAEEEEGEEGWWPTAEEAAAILRPSARGGWGVGRPDGYRHGVKEARPLPDSPSLFGLPEAPRLKRDSDFVEASAFFAKGTQGVKERSDQLSATILQSHARLNAMFADHSVSCGR